MKVLIFGGTGAIGQYLTDILSSKNINVYVTSRICRPDKVNIKYIVGNAHDNAFLEKVLKNKWDVIVDFMSYKTEEFKCRLDCLLTHTDQYIFVSSARVYGNDDCLITERTPRLLDCSHDQGYLATDEYALTKARQENLLLNGSKINFTIVRPYITYGNDRLQLGVLEKEEWLYRALKGRTIVFPEELIDKYTTFTNGYDVAYGISCLIGNKSAHGEAIHLVNNKSMRWIDILKIYEKAIFLSCGLQIKYKFVPTDDFLKCRNPELRYQFIYDRLFNRRFDTTKQDYFTTSHSFIDVEDGVVSCIKNSVANKRFKNISWRYEAVKDKLTKERTPLSEIPTFKGRVVYFLYRNLF